MQKQLSPNLRCKCKKSVACAYEVRRWYTVDQIRDFVRKQGGSRDE
jgi:hypothetical protein